jgi:hypothetical protein
MTDGAAQPTNGEAQPVRIRLYFGDAAGVLHCNRPSEVSVTVCIFTKLPKYNVAFKPGVLWVRCKKCGQTHQEYFGPRNRDERTAEMMFLRHELQVALKILADRPTRSSAKRRGRASRR